MDKIKRNRFALDSMDLDFANEILEDEGYQNIKLTNKRKMILATLLYINGIDEKDSNGCFFVENLFLCKLIGITERTLIKSLKYLQSIGIISRISGKRGSASLYKIEEKYSEKYSNNLEKYSDKYSNKVVDNQVVRELRTEKYSDKYSKKYSTDIDIEEDKDLDIDKEIEIKKDIELNKDKNNINNILINYILNLNNNINNINNNINNNILYIKEKNNKKEKEIEELNFKVSQLIEKVEMNNNNNKENFEINMKENLKENITPSQDVLEMILAKLTSIETRITSIEEEIKSLKGQNCVLTASNEQSNIITPIEEDNATEAKEIASEANYINPMEIAKAVFAKKDDEIEKRSIPTFVDCSVKVSNQVAKKVEESPRTSFNCAVTASNDVSGTIVPQDKNNATGAKEMSDKPMTDEEWDKFCKEVDSKNQSKKNITRDVMGSFVPCSGSSEGWIEGKKQFTSMEEIDKEIAVWKGKGLDIMQIATRFKVNKETFTMTDKLYSPSKVSNQIEVKKDENITPSVVNEKVNKVTEIVAKVNKDTEKTAVEEVNNYTKENVYYAETNTATFERENDNWTSTEEALDNIFSSDFNTDEDVPMSKLKEEMERRKQHQAVEVPF